MGDGLNKLDKQVDEKVQANCKKTRKMWYKALEDKLWHAEVYSRRKHFSVLTEFKQKANRKIH